MTRNRILKLLLLILAIFYAFKCAKIGHDFEVFVYAGHKIIHGLNIYKPPFVQNLQYYYSPLFALLLAPVSGLPIIVSQLAWICLSYFFLYKIWNLSLYYFDLTQLTSKQKNIWLAISVFLALRFILLDIGYVQMTIFLLWATLQSIHWIRNGKPVAGAALLAFVINIKLLPLAFLVYLIYRSRFKAALYTVLFYVFYLYLPALYLGWHLNTALLHDWFALINPTNKEWIVEAENGPSSLVALIPVYITHTTGVLSFKRNFIDLDFGTVSIILNIVRLMFMLLTLLFLRSRPFKEISNQVRSFWEMCYFFLVIPLIYPHQQVYAFMYITPAFIYLSWYLVTNWQRIKAKLNYFHWALLAFIFVNFSPIIGRDVISRYVCDILLYYRILTIAVICLIPILWICRPVDRENQPVEEHVSGRQ